jgi:AraC family transcriptional regulator
VRSFVEIGHTDWSGWQAEREDAMCPACLSTTALLLAGAGSGGLSALLAHRLWRTRKEDAMTTETKPLPVPTFANGRPLRIAGLRAGYTFARRHEIHEQWRRFGERWFGRVPGGVSPEAYGISLAPAPGFDFAYVCGVEVSDHSLVPPELECLEIPAYRQARFVHGGPVTELPATIDAVMDEWLPRSGLAVDAAAHPEIPTIVEWYGASFDPATGRGDMEVWVPVRG